MRLMLAILLLCAGAAHGSDMPPEVQFSDLSDPAARVFDDPFREMGPARLEDLKTVVRLEDRLTTGDLDEETRQRLEALQVAAQDRLAANGYDIEALLAQRWTVARHRRQALVATNPAFEGAEAVLTGYLIPAGTDESGMAVGYIVPVVGMCSHIPAPPPNQLVRLRYDPAQATASIYLPVRVSGTLRTAPSDETIHLLDGYVRMQSLWHLEAQAIVAEGPEMVGAGVHKPFDPLQVEPTVQSARSLN